MRLLHLASTLSFISLALAWTTYTVPHSSGKDDTPALTAAFSANSKLSTDATILFRKGVTYNILTPIRFPYLKNVVISVQGNLTYASDIKATQAIVASSSYPGFWFAFTGGSNVTLEGSQDPQWGWVDSHGQQWWDAMQDAAQRVKRPYGWGFQGITNGEIKYMKLWQPIAWSFSAGGCSNLHVHHNTIMAISNNKASPFNTDGFGVQGTNMLFEDNNIYNGDDCLTINSPVNNIHFRNSYCNGGHGLSIIGSMVQSSATVNIQNVMIENVVMENSMYGARFKSWTGGGGGLAKNITWKDITLKKVLLPIFITQNYWDSSLGQKPTSTSTNTQIDTFTFQNFHGTIDNLANYTCARDPCWFGIAGGTGEEVAVFDLYAGTAKSIVAKNIAATTLSGAPVRVMCNSAAISTDVGFKCWNGLFQATSAGK